MQVSFMKPEQLFAEVRNKKLVELKAYHNQPPTQEAKEIISLLKEMKGGKAKKPTEDDKLINAYAYWWSTFYKFKSNHRYFSTCEPLREDPTAQISNQLDILALLKCRRIALLLHHVNTDELIANLRDALCILALTELKLLHNFRF